MLGIRTVCGRVGPVVAHDSDLMVRLLLLPFRLGLGGRLGSGRQWFSWVAIEDVVGGLAFMLEHEALSGPIKLVVPRACTNIEFTRALGQVLHRPTLFPVPAMALRLAFGSALADEAVLSDQRVVPARLLEAGYHFALPTIEDALRAHLGPRDRFAA